MEEFLVFLCPAFAYHHVDGADEVACLGDSGFPEEGVAAGLRRGVGVAVAHAGYELIGAGYGGGDGLGEFGVVVE